MKVYARAEVSLSYYMASSCVKIVYAILFIQVVRCCLEHAASVAKTFLTCDVVVVEIKEPEPAAPAGNPMDNSGK